MLPCFRLLRGAGETKQADPHHGQTHRLARTPPERPGARRRRRGGRPASRPYPKTGRLVDDRDRRAGRGQRHAGLRRDGTAGVTEILTHDLALFGGILPRVLAGCLLGAFIAEILPHEKVSRSLGPNSGLKGLLIGAAFGAILPGGPFTAYPVASALLAVGADFGATIAMVVSWTLIGYGRAVAWELPIMGTDFTLWRIVISLPLPVLAGALGRFVYVRMYPKAAP